MRKFIPWILSVVLMTIILTLTVSVDLPVGKPGRSAAFYVGSILTPWPAYATVDYQCDGVDDHIQIQQALDALPVNGGKIVIYAGNYHLGATVSRAIDSIVIEGVGAGTYLANNGVTNIFNMGVQKRWVFKDFQADNGGVNVATGTEWSFDNVWIGGGYIAKRSAFTTTQGQDMANKIYVDGAIAGLPASTGNITGGGLTNRIVKWVNSTSIGDGSNTDAQVSATVLASHTQGTDTTLGSMVANITMGNHEINGLSSPYALTDAATKGYVDNAISGVGSGSGNVTATGMTLGYVPLSTSTTGITNSIVSANGTMVSMPLVTGVEICPAISAANWTGGAGWTVGAGTLTRVASVVTTTYPTVSIAPTVNLDYLASFTISSWTAGTITVTLGGVESTSLQGNQNVYLYISPYTVDNLIFTPSATFAGVISAVSVKSFAGADLLISDDLLYYDSRGHPNRLAHVTRHLSEMQTDTLLDKSRSTLTCAGGVLTYTLYAVYGQGTWNFNGVVYPGAVASANVTLTGGTDAAPKTNWVYFELVGNTPTLSVSTTAEPTTNHIMVAEFIVGAVSGSSYNIYAYNRYRVEVDSFVKRVIERTENSGTLYESGALPTVTQNTPWISVASGGTWYAGIFKHESGNIVNGTAFYFIKNGVYTAGTSLADLLFYTDATAVPNHGFANIVWGIVPTTTTASGSVPTTVKLVACLQTKPTVDYSLITTVRQDLYEATNYFPPDTQLKECFVPIARTIISEDAPTQLQTFDTGIYWKDLRGRVTSGGGAATGTDTSGLLDLAGTRSMTGSLDMGATGNITLAAGMTVDGVDISTLSTTNLTTSITFVIDGGDFDITTGGKGDLEIPFACTINRATALATQTGNITVSIWKSTYVGFPPVLAGNITASAPVTISSSNKSQDSALAGWTTTIVAGDILRYNVDSCDSIRRVTVSLRAIR